MIFEDVYFAGKSLRWNMGWPTPNYAGAFLCTLVVLSFGFSHSRWRWIALLGEAVGLYLLAKTYSRGGIFAWVVAWGFATICMAKLSCSFRKYWAIWVARMLILSAILLAVDFQFSRDKTDSPMADRPDTSVVNRIVLWKGATRMIAAAPTSGWGHGESGSAYMNWYQDVTATEGYSTMVNSYLDLGVCYGLPVLILVFSVVLLIPTIAISATNLANSETWRISLVSAGAAWIAWAVASVFTTLWLEPKLWIAPLIIVGFIIRAQRDFRNIWRNFIKCTLGSCFASCVLLGVGRVSAGDETQPYPYREGIILKTGNRDGVTWHVWVDKAVLGPVPGKSIRVLAHRITHDPTLITYPDSIDKAEVRAGDVIILIGKHSARLCDHVFSEAVSIFLVHPLGGPPPKNKNRPLRLAKGVVILPGVDEVGNANAWSEWGGTNGFEIVKSKGSGNDLQGEWSHVADMLNAKY